MSDDAAPVGAQALTGTDLERPARDRAELVDLLEVFLLGETPSLSGRQIAEEVGLDLEEVRRRWRSLGFAAVEDDVAAFTHADLEALRLTEELIGLGVVEGVDQQALVRSLGRSFARLADWQMGMLARAVDPDEMTLRELADVLETVTPAVSRLHDYVWRRHTLLAASRLLNAAERGPATADGPEGPEAEGAAMAVGFADIVGYTRQSRSLSRRELTRLVDGFEARALEVMTTHDARIIKTIGDEVLFVADTPRAAADVALELVAERDRDDDFPELRVGLAWGTASARLGDVLGPVVNIASRLTSTARPGTVLMDRALAERLEDHDDLRLRRLRRTSVKGYRRLEPWSLRREPRARQDIVAPG